MNALETFNKQAGRSGNKQQLGSVVAVATTAITVIQKIKPLKKIADGIKNLTSFLNKPDDSDFGYARNKIDGWLKSAKYADANHTTWTSFKINPGAIPNTKSKGETYEPEYKKLQAWLVARMNLNNPGLGNLWLEFFPNVKMKDSDESDWSNWNAAKEFMNAFPPGTFNINSLTPAELQEIKAAIVTDQPLVNTASKADVLQTLANGLTVIKDAAGQIKQIRDAAGNLLNQTDPRYQQAVTEAYQPQQAGMSTAGKIIVGVLGLSALTFIATQSGGHSKPVKKGELNGPHKKKRKKSKSANS